MTKTNCDVCNGNLDMGQVTLYRDGVEIRTICFSCDKEERFSAYKESKQISTNLMLDSILVCHDLKNGRPLKSDYFKHLKSIAEINEATEALQIKCKQFENLVWFNGLQNEVDRCRFKGLDAENDEVCVLTYTMCGRCMITFKSLDDKDYDHVTFLTAADSTSSVMGLHGISCTYEKALNLVNNAIKGWENKSLKFKVNKEINMGF